MSDLWRMVKALAFTHIWIALGAAGAAAATLLVHGYPADTWTPLIVSGILGIGVSTGCIYTWQRRIKLRKNPESIPTRRRAFLQRSENAMALVWVALALVWAVASASLWKPYAELLLSHAGVLAIMAALALGYASNPLTGGRGLRDIPRVKWPVIAVAWGLVTGWLPLQFVPDAVDVSFLAQSVFLQTVFVAGITLPFDVRDVAVDPVGLRTVPQQVGDRTTTWLALALVGLSTIGFWTLDPIAGRAVAGMVALLGIGVASILRREWVFSLWLDGCLILQGVLAFLMV